MNDLSSPLQMIRQKELALRRRVDQAQRAAAEQLAAVRQEIAQVVGEAEQTGRIEAEIQYRQGVTAAREEAAAVVTAAQAEAEALQAVVSQRLDDVAGWVAALILDLPVDEVAQPEQNSQSYRGDHYHAPPNGKSSDYRYQAV